MGGEKRGRCRWRMGVVRDEKGGARGGGGV